MMLGFLTRPLITNFVRTLGFTTVLLILAVWPLHPLDIYMEENRPFNYSSDQGLSGISVELLLAASDAVGLGITRKDIQVVPWVRGYQLIGEKADTVLFSTARTEARENQFLWAGPIASLEIVVIGPRDITINQFSDLKKYTIGTIRNDVAEQLLQAQGFPLEKIQRGISFDGNVKMLINGRVDLITYNNYSWLFKINQLNSAYSEAYKPLWTLSKTELWYAFNRNSNTETVKTLQRGIDIIKDSGKYQEILSRYIGSGFIRD